MTSKEKNYDRADKTEALAKKVYKKDSADVVADEIMEIQQRSAATHRISDAVLTICCALLVGIAGLMVYLLPWSDFSQEENRQLQSFPTLSLKKLTSNEIAEDISAFYADQFPLRNTFVGIKAVTEMVLLKQENNGIMVCKDGYLVPRHEYDSYSILDENVSTVNEFVLELGKIDVDVSVALVPRPVDVLKDKLPLMYGEDRSDAVWERVSELSGTSVDLKAILTEKSLSGSQVYYKTDHHWTTLGAYYAYLALSTELGYTPVQIEDITIEKISDSFLGTAYSASGAKWVSADSMELFHLKGEEEYITEIVDTGEKIKGFYDFSYLESKDKYSTFIGGNNAYVRIRSENNTGRERLVIIKDSYAHSIAPFLAMHYDLDIIDLRYYRGTVAEILKESEATKVLLLYGIDSFATLPLQRLAYGMDQIKNININQ